jgi:hypothetical protein
MKRSRKAAPKPKVAKAARKKTAAKKARAKKKSKFFPPTLTLRLGGGGIRLMRQPSGKSGL